MKGAGELKASVIRNARDRDSMFDSYRKNVIIFNPQADGRWVQDSRAETASTKTAIFAVIFRYSASVHKGKAQGKSSRVVVCCSLQSEKQGRRYTVTMPLRTPAWATCHARKVGESLSYSSCLGGTLSCNVILVQMNYF